jgi:hypothetical protein
MGNKTANNIAAAFLQGRRLSLGHARTDGTALTYRGNTIARRQGGRVEISTQGWDTPTTRRYLSALGFRVHRLDGALHLNGCPWSGGWVDPETVTPETVDP